MDDTEFEGKPSRNSLQKVALVAIYDALTYIDMGMDVDVKDIVSSLCDMDYADCDYFVKAALLMVLKHHDEAIEAFNAKMNHWTFSRLDRVKRSVLLLAYAHYYYVEPEVDKAVVIDIAMKQAKQYFESKECRFVNAILDNVLDDGKRHA